MTIIEGKCTMYSWNYAELLFSVSSQEKVAVTFMTFRFRLDSFRLSLYIFEENLMGVFY